MTTSIDAILLKFAEVKEQRDDALARIRVVRKIVDDYLNHGEGGGGRSICLRIVQALEAK